MTRLAFFLSAPLVLLAACTAETAPEASEEVDPDQVACPLVPMEPIKVETIAAAYEANEAAAQKKYGNQCVLVSGTVEEVDLDMSDEPIIRLANDDLVSPTVRLLDAALDQAVELQKGQETFFLCNEVTEFLGTPTMDGCYVVFPKTEPAS